ncbi:MAG: S8 family serine peptidase, partial [Candidatus Omnitrophica bacterium]|nr:S8 family serine peptidase [Candidatus Omnitrophota bacterium]
MRLSFAFPLLFAFLTHANCETVASSALAKLSPALRDLSRKGEAEKVFVTVSLSSNKVSLGSILHDQRVTSPAGMTLARGYVEGRNLQKLASVPGVEFIWDAGSREAPKPPDPDLKPRPRKKLDPEELQKALKAAPPYSKTPPPVKRQPGAAKSWWGKDLLGVQEAWNMGVTGAGVKIGIMDTGVDFANPDLMGTQARVDNPGSVHHGWPIVFDGNSMYRYSLYGRGESEEGGITGYCDTFVIPGSTIISATMSRSFYHFINGGGGQEAHEFTYLTESVSGKYHFGHHPDESLRRDVLNGYRPTVLVVDHPDVANRGPGYNTVYVDLDNDGDFTDEKPCYKGNEISYRDINGDGYADVSGGMVYFIANGARPIPASDWLYGIPPPDNGDLVAFSMNDTHGEGGNHGTTCASAAVAQGIINGDAPPYKPPYGGPGDGMVQGPAPGAKIVDIGNYYAGGFDIDYQMFVALGYDGVANTGDEPNIVSMSFGYGYTDNETWDAFSRLIESLNRRVAPMTTWVHSSGNGGHGFSTITVPSPPGAVTVGACTSFDTCDEFDSIQSTDQILSGDIISFSGAGPGTNGRQVVSVVAHGAWGSGDIPVNTTQDGFSAWELWGGTSRSCPEAAGVLALIYQAHKQKHGAFPDSDTARQLLMNSATDLKYDVFQQGAGRVHAGRAATLASETEGIAASPASWEVGNFRGVDYEAYAPIAHRGQTHAITFTLTNPGPMPVSLQVRDVNLEQFDSTDIAIHTIATTSEERNTRKPDYLMPFHVPGTVTHIPPDTALATFQAYFPFDVFDVDYTPGDPSTITLPRENGYRIIPYDWTDKNLDGNLFDDSVGDVPGLVEHDEIDSGEYMRFNYGYVDGTSLLAYVADPLAKMHDGIYIGVQHKSYDPPIAISTTIPIRARYYREADCPWLSTQGSMITVPAQGSAELHATVDVPTDMPFGSHSAKILLEPTGGKSLNPRTVIPVSLNVAVDISTGVATIDSATEGAEPYVNNHLRGGFSWGGRSECGDTRIFFLDSQSPDPGSFLVARTEWEDPAPTDIDTVLFGPSEDVFTTPGEEEYHSSFGPNTLVPIGGDHSPSRPNNLYHTSTGTSLDYSVGPLADGLHALLVHNTLFGGTRFEVPFSIELGEIKLAPSPLEIHTLTATLVQPVTLTSTLPFTDFQFDAWGPSKVEKLYGVTVPNQGYYSETFTLTDGALLDFLTASQAPDIDLYL